MVAVVLLGIAASGIAAMALQSSRASSDTEAIGLRDAALHTAVDRVTVAPYAELPELAGCDDRGDERFGYMLCVRVEEEGEHLKAVTVRVEPDAESVPAASAVILRSRATPPSPF
jgi:hypothetical protein